MSIVTLFEKIYKIYCNVVGAVTKWLRCWTADAEVTGSSPQHGMEE